MTAYVALRPYFGKFSPKTKSGVANFVAYAEPEDEKFANILEDILRKDLGLSWETFSLSHKATDQMPVADLALLLMKDKALGSLNLNSLLIALRILHAALILRWFEFNRHESGSRATSEKSESMISVFPLHIFIFRKKKSPGPL
jgi:hypothetical protein